VKRDEEMRRLANHPRRTMEQSRKLARDGWLPFPELTVDENDVIFCARLAGMGESFPAYPDAATQARRTLEAAGLYLDAKEPERRDEPY
jgi:hypothetical protein